MFPPNPELHLDYLCQFRQPEKTLAIFPGAAEVGEGFHAALFGVSPERYRAALGHHAAQAHLAAQALLDEQGFAADLAQVPFANGSTVIGLGDSITADRQSWLEVLRHALELTRPGEVRLVNAGISGNTTADAISRFVALPPLRPDWLITLLGTNDARLHGPRPAKTLVSADESRANLYELRELTLAQTQARRLWVTPPPVFEPRQETHWLPTTVQMRWRNPDIARVAEAVRQMPDPVIDLWPSFADKAEALIMYDGLHPNLEGQKQILRAVVEGLARLEA